MLKREMIRPAAIGGAIMAALLALTSSGAFAASILETVRSRGHLVCGVSEGTPGFSQAYEKGVWSGLDVDFCAGLAAAVLGNRDAVKFVPLTATDRFRALKAGEVDVLARSTTWTLSRDTEFGIKFAGILFHDGHGFLVRRVNAVGSVLELSGASICSISGTQSEQAVADFFGGRAMRYQLVTSQRWDEVVRTYNGGGCTALTGEVTTLALERSRMLHPAEHILLPELISKEPYGPAVRGGDDQWFAIVRWTVMALVEAEELGLTSATIEGMRASQKQGVRRFLGLEANLGQGMGLARDWAYQVVRQVGGYGELFERNLGARSALRLERGLNNLWAKGGLMYAVPFR